MVTDPNVRFESGTIRLGIQGYCVTENNGWSVWCPFFMYVNHIAVVTVSCFFQNTWTFFSWHADISTLLTVFRSLAIILGFFPGVVFLVPGWNSMRSSDGKEKINAFFLIHCLSWKEGLYFVMIKVFRMLVIKREVCGYCGACVSVCPEGALELVDAYLTVDPETCIECGICSKICPLGALEVKNAK